MTASVVSVLISLLLTSSLSLGADKWLVGTVKGNESGTIEITGETAKLLFVKLENIKGKETIGELSKIGKNIRCSRLGIEAKDYSYKCSFQVGKKGELDPPQTPEGLTPAM
jgi:hypothetical protein